MKILLWLWFGLAFFNLQTLSADQSIDPATGLPTTVSTNTPVGDMYHYTEEDEVELQAALTDYNLILGQYQDFAGKFSVINFKALDSGPDGCRIEMGGNDYYLHGFKASSDRYYTDITVKDSGDYTYSTVNNSSRTIPSYTACSSEELQALSAKRTQTAQAQLKYSKLAKKKANKIANERALSANIESAERGEGYGLRRMAERYRKGDGVEKDLKKADNLLKKADEADQSDENRLLIAKQMKQENDDIKTFQHALKLAEIGEYTGAATAAECYRDGKGTEKDLNKALEYYRKAQILEVKNYNPHPNTYQNEIDEIVKQLKPVDKTGY